MNQANPLRNFWFGDGDPIPAQERLRRVMARLIRAQRLQLMLDYGCGGALAGLGLATAAVLVARLVPSPYSPWEFAGAAVIIALAVALWAGWRRRPDALEVAICADLRLKLKQRLSTAWEFMTVHGNGELAERLAVQAVKARLPVSPGLAFPLRVNRWGRLVPLAASALLLAAVLDLNWTQPQAPHAVDERVVIEGQRLGAFASAMQARARQNELPRSARQAGELERLGARMESGALSRAQALEQLHQTGRSLDEESLQALADANDPASGPMRGERSDRWAEAQDPNPGAMPEPASKGSLHSGDTRVLKEGRDDPTGSGNPRRELDEATRRLLAGEDEGQEDQALGDRARKEHDELRLAREQVRQARENLGESLAGLDGGGGAAAGTGTGQSADDPGDDPEEKRREGSRAADGSRSGSRGDSSAAGERQRSPFSPDSGQPGPVLKPSSQVRAGEVFVFQGRVLPGEGRPSVENVQMSDEFARQVEEVLAREDYPAHYKAFIRRYFLSLSHGARAPQPQPSGTR